MIIIIEKDSLKEKAIMDFLPRVKKSIFAIDDEVRPKELCTFIMSLFVPFAPRIQRIDRT